MKFSYSYRLSTFAVFIFFAISQSLQAQITGAVPDAPVATDSIKYAFLPALAYNSDLGLIGGGILSRYHNRAGSRPFHSYLNLNAIASTKGLASFQVFHDKPNVLHSNMRFTSEVYVSRFMQNQYYGIGNYRQLPDAPEGKPNYYLYKSFSTGFEFVLRRPLLYNAVNNGQLDVFGLVSFSYRTPYGNGPNRLISEDQPEGIGGTNITELGTGLIWENRDSEFAPTKGAYTKAGVMTGQKFIGSSYNYLLIESEARTYLSFFLIREITFANRLSFNHTSGELPYWKLAELGGEQTMRGYPEHRYRDDNALFLNTELRTWLLEFPEYDFRLGGTLFMDIGRTFANGTALDNVFNDLKYTFGFGGTSSFFTKDFIFRADVGFSDEGHGIYFTAGYMF